MYLTHPEELESHIRSFPMRDIQADTYKLSFETDEPRRVLTD